MSEHQCSYEGCDEKDGLVGIGRSDETLTYYCTTHFGVACRRVAAFVKRNRSRNRRQNG